MAMALEEHCQVSLSYADYQAPLDLCTGQLLWHQYEHTCLLFGCGLAPGAFSKCLEPLRCRVLRILAYLNYLLILAQSPDLAIQNTISLVNHFTRLGFVVS